MNGLEHASWLPLVLPRVSVAVHLTEVVPIGNVRQGVGRHTGATAPSTKSVAVNVAVTGTPDGPVASARIGLSREHRWRRIGHGHLQLLVHEIAGGVGGGTRPSVVPTGNGSLGERSKNSRTGPRSRRAR